MILDLLDPVFLEQQRVSLIAHLNGEANRIEGGHPGAVSAAAENGVTADDLRAAAVSLADTSANLADTSLAYIPGVASLSTLQYALEKAWDETGTVADVQISGLAPGEAAFVPVTARRLPDSARLTELAVSGLVEFQDGDPGYAAGYILARLIRLTRHRPPFVNTPARANIADHARVILVGDWGSGVARAAALAEQVKLCIAAAPDRQCHVIHLGDVYFAGLGVEYEQRFFPHWPTGNGRSWCIPGNHDMYTGGTAFFDTLLAAPQFQAQQGSTWFVLENNNWQLFGLDSSYSLPNGTGMDGELEGTQSAEMLRLRFEAPNKAGVLFTHHQPFDAQNGTYRPRSAEMVESLGTILDAGMVKAWFWGHEHECNVYHPWRNVEYPCLTGNAGVPSYFKKVDPDAVIRWSWPDAIQTPDGHYATMGFTVLDFTNETLDISFYNEFGVRQTPPGPAHQVKAR